MVLAIAGIGSDNVVGISVDNGARIDIAALEEKLDENLRARQPVFAVVAIVGSTEGIETDLMCNITIALMKKTFRGSGRLSKLDFGPTQAVSSKGSVISCSC